MLRFSFDVRNGTVLEQEEIPCKRYPRNYNVLHLYVLMLQSISIHKYLDKTQFHIVSNCALTFQELDTVEHPWVLWYCQSFTRS